MQRSGRIPRRSVPLPLLSESYHLHRPVLDLLDHQAAHQQVLLAYRGRLRGVGPPESAIESTTGFVADVPARVDALVVEGATWFGWRGLI